MGLNRPKEVRARMQQKHDIEANWLKAVDFIPLAGEIIVYDADENFSQVRFKIGDGETNVNDLPFVTSETLFIRGEGENSIVQNVEWQGGTTDEPMDAQPKAYSLSSMALGPYCIAGNKDDQNIGQHSAAFNYDSEAINTAAFAANLHTIASGPNSFAVNRDTTAEDEESFAAGRSTHARAKRSFAAGLQTDVKKEAENGFVCGESNTVYTKNSFVGGYNSRAGETHAYMKITKDYIFRGEYIWPRVAFNPAVIPGVTYIIKFNQAFELTTEGTHCPVVRIEYLDQNKNTLVSFDFPKTTSDKQARTEIIGESIAPSNAAFVGISIIFYWDSAGTVEFDDIVFYPKDNENNILFKETFESSMEYQWSPSYLDQCKLVPYDERYGKNSFVWGEGAISKYDNQVSLGEYNNPNSGAKFMIGNGSDEKNRSNAFEVHDDHIVINKQKFAVAISELGNELPDPNNYPDGTLLLIYNNLEV